MRTTIDAGRPPVALPGKPAARPRVRDRARALVAEFNAAPPQWRHVSLGIAAALAVVLALGAVYDATGRLHWFEIRGEVVEGGFYVPVLFNWWMLLFAGVAAALRSRWAETDAERNAWLGIGAFLAFMGFDELLMIHERLEFHTGVDWQLLYVPVVAVGGVAYLMLLKRMPRWSLAQAMWITAASFWFVSEIFEKLEYTGDDVEVSQFKLFDGIEKFFQFTGSGLFLLVALLALERATERSDS
jgi:hypothetical protein